MAAANGYNIYEWDLSPLLENESRELLEKSTATATALNPYLGYQAVSRIVKEAIRENKTIKEIILKHNLIEESDLSRILGPEAMTRPVEPDTMLMSKIKNSRHYDEFLKKLWD